MKMSRIWLMIFSCTLTICCQVGCFFGPSIPASKKEAKELLAASEKGDMKRVMEIVSEDPLRGQLYKSIITETVYYRFSHVTNHYDGPRTNYAIGTTYPLEQELAHPSGLSARAR